jgi:MFS family permease
MQQPGALPEQDEPDPGTSPASARAVRRAVTSRPSRLSDRQLLVTEGFFSGTATAAHQSFFIPLLVQLGIGSLALGIYTAFNGLLTNVSGLAGGALSRRVPNRRTVAALSSGLGRAGFALIAVLLLVGGDSASTILLMAIALAAATLIGLGLPTTTTIVADAVNPRERGTFFANRLLASGIGAAVVAIGIAVLLRQLAFPNGFTITYVLAALAGAGSVISLLSLRRVRRARVPARAGIEQTGGLRGISPLMWRYSFATFVLWFGAGMVAPVLTPYILEDLGASPSFMGLMTAVNSVVALSIQRFWGRRVDRLGAYGTVVVCTFIVSWLPVLYALTPTYWLALLFEVVSGVGWAGYALGSLNYAIEVAPHEERARYQSIANAAGGVGVFLGPLVAAALLSFLAPQVVLLLAGGVRLAAVFATRLAKPDAAHSPVLVPPTGAT